MTVRDLKTLLDSLPDDCLNLPVYLSGDAGCAEARMILIDPPHNFPGVTPKVVLTHDITHQEYPEQIAATFARYS